MLSNKETENIMGRKKDDQTKKREEGGKRERESAHGWRRVGVECIGPAKCESSPAEHMRELRSAMTGM